MNAYLKRFGIRYDQWLSVIFCERDFAIREKLLTGWLEAKKNETPFKWREVLYPRQRRLW